MPSKAPRDILDTYTFRRILVTITKLCPAAATMRPSDFPNGIFDMSERLLRLYDLQWNKHNLTKPIGLTLGRGSNSFARGNRKEMAMNTKTVRNTIAMYSNFWNAPLRRCCLTQTGLFPVGILGGEPIFWGSRWESAESIIGMSLGDDSVVPRRLKTFWGSRLTRWWRLGEYVGGRSAMSSYVLNFWI